MEKFKQLGIIEPILESLKNLGFKIPTEIQEKSIPSVIEGKDIIAGAATGSGKTLAFGTGIIQNSEKQGVIQSLVLVPTRELAEQVAQELRKFAEFKPLNVVDVYGGVSISRQIQKLRKADVVVATPGRLLDHLGQGTVDLGFTKTLVLDEADRMLDMGFIMDVKKIIRSCPKDRQTMLFSATLNGSVIDILDDALVNPLEVSAETKIDASKLSQVFYDVPDNLKFSLLTHLLKIDKSELVMVFCNTKRNTDIIARNLQNQGLNAISIHGGHTQEKRKKSIAQFHAKEVQILVCTDVAARGLDIKEVSHVYNYDIPKETNQYIHRIGRTARAGNEGKAVSILASRDYENFERLIKIENVDIEKKELPDIDRVFIDTRAGRKEGSRTRGPSRPSRGNTRFGGRSGGYNRGPSRGPSRRPRRSNEQGGYARMGSDDDDNYGSERRSRFNSRPTRSRFSNNRDNDRAPSRDSSPRKKSFSGKRKVSRSGVKRSRSSGFKR